MMMKDVDNAYNVTIVDENDDIAGKTLTVQDSPPACLARCLRSSSGPFSLVKQQSAATNRLLEFDGNTKTSRTQPNSISNVFIEKLSEVKSRCVSNGLHGIVPNCGGDC